MKKFFLLSVMALVGLTASAQFNAKSSAVQKTNAKAVNVQQTQRSFQAVAPRQERAVSMGHPGRQLHLNVNNLQPVDRMVSMGKAARANKVITNRSMINLQPTVGLNLSAPRKAAALQQHYTGK